MVPPVSSLKGLKVFRVARRLRYIMCILTFHLPNNTPALPAYKLIIMHQIMPLSLC